MNTSLCYVKSKYIMGFQILINLKTKKFFLKKPVFMKSSMKDFSTFHTMRPYYWLDRNYLLSLSVTKLRNLAKKRDIWLGTIRKKSEIVEAILRDDHDCTLKLELNLDSCKRVEISCWFPGKYRLRTVSRFLASQRCIRLTKKILLKHPGSSLEDIIHWDKTQVFVDLRIAFMAADKIKKDT